MCGFLGVIASRPVAPLLCQGLQALQHRGQDSAGIVTVDGPRFPMHHGLGLVRDVYREPEVLARLTGSLGIGHVRYPTIGRGVLDDAQPFLDRRPGVVMAHNGNITNYEELRAELLSRSIHLLSACDVEPVLCLFADALVGARPRGHTLDDVAAALADTARRTEGAFSLVAALQVDGRPTLLAFRDPSGIRPGVLGRSTEGEWAAASESVALDALGFATVGDLPPGELLVLRPGEEPLRRKIATPSSTPCVFEEIYFARPDSVTAGRPVVDRRYALGRRLAREWRDRGFACDRVIPIPDTSRPAAVAFAEEIGAPYREGFIKNRYSGRTFIMADQISRADALRVKLNPIRAEFEGHRVVVVDDSIVRGSTVQRILAMVRTQGPREVHLVIHAPPVLHPCYYGIDMSTEEELAARRYAPDPRPGGLTLAEQREMEGRWAADLAVDSLTFLSVAGLDAALAERRCAACFDGRYPVPVPAEKRDAIARERRGVGTGS